MAFAVKTACIKRGQNVERVELSKRAITDTKGFEPFKRMRGHIQGTCSKPNKGVHRIRSF